MQGRNESGFDPVTYVENSFGQSPVLVVCEHASNRIPDWMDGLGLNDDLRQSHIAWDLGALAVSEKMSQAFDSVLVSGCISRLIFDLNRPPEAHDAMPAISEVFEIPANAEMTAEARNARIENVYRPFRDRLSHEINARPNLRLLVTVHSFTPVYRGEPRAVELGLLHGGDDRFAKAMLANAPEDLPFKTELNEPYGPQDGVAHTLDRHGTDNGLLNVMLEIRNDLISDDAGQTAFAELLVPWITDTLTKITKGDV